MEEWEEGYGDDDFIESRPRVPKKRRGQTPKVNQKLYSDILSLTGLVAMSVAIAYFIWQTSYMMIQLLHQPSWLVGISAFLVYIISLDVIWRRRMENV